MGTVQLIFDLGARAAPSDAALACGPRSVCSIIDTRSQSSTLGIHFKPGGAFPFLKLPVDELQNTHLSLESLWGNSASELCDRLFNARSLADRFRILEESLTARLASRSLHPAVAIGLREFQRVPLDAAISEVAELVGLCTRRFIRLFRDQVGLTPKLHCRLRRFQTALHLMRRQRHVDWTHLAMACGYYDQPHFINEFRTFSGLNPTEYLQQQGEHVNHVVIRH